MSQDLLPFAPVRQVLPRSRQSLFSVALFEPQASQRLKDLRLYVDERCDGLLAVRGPVSVPKRQARGDRAGNDEGTFMHGPVMRPAKKQQVARVVVPAVGARLYVVKINPRGVSAARHLTAMVITT